MNDKDKPNNSRYLFNGLGKWFDIAWKIGGLVAFLVILYYSLDARISASQRGVDFNTKGIESNSKSIEEILKLRKQDSVMLAYLACQAKLTNWANFHKVVPDPDVICKPPKADE